MRTDSDSSPARTTPSPERVLTVLQELHALENPKIRAVNERHGDDHGVNLTQLRAVAKRLGRDESLARELWSTGETPARLVSLLMFRPKSLTADEIDAMLREARVPKVQDWLLNYHAKKSPHILELRERWMSDASTVVAGAAWALTAHRIAHRVDEIVSGTDASGIDLDELLSHIDTNLLGASDRLQWAMNECLAHIGIASPLHRSRALEIGERLGVYRDYPTPPGCTSPFAPAWITEIVRRNEASA